MGMAYAQDPQGWKRPWGLWGVGLRLKEQKGLSRAPHPWSQRTGDSPGSPAGFLGSSGWCKCPPLLFCSSDLGGPLPPPSPDLPSLSTMPPMTHAAWRGLWRAGDRPGTSAASLCPSGWGKCSPLPHSSWMAPPSCLSCSPLSLLPMPPRTHVTWRGLWRAGDWPGSSAGSPRPSGQGNFPCSSPSPPRGPLPSATPDLLGLPPMPPAPMWPGWGFGGGGTSLGTQQAPLPEWARQSPSAPLPLFPESPLQSPSSPDLPSLKGADPVWPPLLLPAQSPYILLAHFGVPPVSLGIRVPHQQPAASPTLCLPTPLS